MKQHLLLKLFLLLIIIGCNSCFGNPTAVRVPVIKRISFPVSGSLSSLGGTLYLPQEKVLKIVIVLNTVVKESPHPDFTPTKDTLSYDRDFISHLTNNRIGVLLIDRHSSRSSYQLHVEQSAKTLSSDAEQASLYLKKDPALKDIPIGVFGSSEAGLAATMFAAGNKDVSFLILSSTPGTNGIELNEYSVFSPVFDNNRFLHITSGLQTMIADSVFIYDSKRYPMTSRSEDIRSFYLCINKTFREIERKVILQYEDYDTIRVKAGALFRELWQGNNFKTNTKNMYGIEIPAEQYMDTIIKYWYRPSIIEISRWEPQNYFPYIDCPVLMLYGEKDININLEASMASVNKIISIYNKSNFVVKGYENLDHSLLPTMEKTAEKERRKVPEYVLNDIVLWIDAILSPV